MYGDTVPDHQIDNLLQIMNMKVRNFTVGKVTCSEIFGFLYVSVRAIPTYRVYWLYDYVYFRISREEKSTSPSPHACTH